MNKKQNNKSSNIRYLMDRDTKYGHTIAFKKLFPDISTAIGYIDHIVGKYKYLEDEFIPVRCHGEGISDFYIVRISSAGVLVDVIEVLSSFDETEMRNELTIIKVGK